MRENISYIAYSPLAMGLLSGKYTAETSPPQSRFALYERYRKQYLTKENLSSMNQLKIEARRRGVSLAEFAYWWCLTRPAVGVVLTSISRLDQLKLSQRATELALRKTVPELGKLADLRTRYKA